MDERTVMLNMLAQGLRPIEQGVEWFEDLPAENQFEVLRDLCGHCMQARATEGDGPESVRRAGLRPTYTPAVLITRGQLNVQLAKIINLPQDERVKAFRLLVALLGVADERRRERFCADRCGHAWHQLAKSPDSGAAIA
ncbi:hypothetical protein M2168_006224 [Streptomyces sp. CZ24]|uniref:DUF5958 family protein n=1 Tax=Streptomyces albidoflavus TaxID=1886 RepID=UPI0024768438|nr:DUF5958 family protein [Streptomyces sp. CZ24]MDH6193106.1 hypothetical protein [Streptomyces sp. CZ24]